MTGRTARSYLRPLGVASAALLATSVHGAEPSTLTGEAIGVGPVRLNTLATAPIAIVLVDRTQADAATPVGVALNAVMVAHGGNRVSALDLSGLWRVTRPPARLLMAEVRDRAIETIAQGYAARGQPVPDNMGTERAWLVADWEGTWKAALAPECAGLAVAILDEGLRPYRVLCEPTVDQATAAFRAVLDVKRPN
jgi:hypothetical protein